MMTNKWSVMMKIERDDMEGRSYWSDDDVIY